MAPLAPGLGPSLRLGKTASHPSSRGGRGTDHDHGRGGEGGVRHCSIYINIHYGLGTVYIIYSLYNIYSIYTIYVIRCDYVIILTIISYRYRSEERLRHVEQEVGPPIGTAILTSLTS